jgi:16S rRNA processing protein RimM
MPSAERIAIGIIKRPVGLQGLCAVEPFGSTLPNLEAPCSVFLGKDAASADEIGLDDVLVRGNGPQVHFVGMNDRDAVERLRGLILFVNNDALPELPPNEFYHDELKGMEIVSDANGSSLGTVIDVLNLPSMDTIDVRLKNGLSILVPLGGQAVIAVDRAARKITVSQSFVEELLE